MSVEIRKSSVDEIEENINFPQLASEYADESAIDGLPDPVSKLDYYKIIEQSNMFEIYAAFDGYLLIGFVAIIIPVVPHYGVSISVAESLFVGKEYRKTGAGLKLIRRAEKVANDRGSPGILLSAPSGGILQNILPKMKYRETNRVFFKGFK